MTRLFTLRKQKILGYLLVVGTVVQMYFIISDVQQDGLVVHPKFNAARDKEETRRLFAARVKTYDEYQKQESNRTGPGEGGEAVPFSPEEMKIILKEMKEEGFSKYANANVSLERGLKDYRPDVCKTVDYPEDLPTASVVIIFCNELLPVIMRTVHSLINRTPPRYLKEVILVDDASKKAELRGPLEDYISEHLPSGLVSVIRLNKRSGLIRARMAGVRAAAGQAVVMMDSHMEVSKGWIEPLLSTIKKNNRTLVAPTIDAVEPKTLKYLTVPLYLYQSFKWNMEYMWTSHPDLDKMDPLQPLPTYTLVGCIMAMNTRMFLEMGGFDEGLDIWGGENVELPFRIWMCGGRVEIIPCSRVAHTYRAGYGRPWNDSGDYFQRNSQRVAETWLDEYKDQYYILHPDMESKRHLINITAQEALKKRLKCKGFKWFVEEVVKPAKFLYNRDVECWGKAQNGVGSMCLDTLGVSSYEEGKVGVYPCYSPRGFNQLFTLTRQHQLRREDSCVMYREEKPGHNVTITSWCTLDPKNQWDYQPFNGTIVHRKTGLCLDASGVKAGPTLYVVLNPCAEKNSQKWIWENYVGQA